MPIFCILLQICCTPVLLVGMVSAGVSLPSTFYKVSPGIIIKTWLSSTQYTFDNFKNIPDFPGCPTYVRNADNLEHSQYSGKNQHVRLSSFFVSPQTGKHKFFAICSSKCRLYMELNPKGFVNILDVNAQTNDNWSERKFSAEVDLTKGFRYELVVYHAAWAFYTGFLRLGVQFPDGSEAKPIGKDYLRRSIDHYKWTGLLAQRYESFQLGSKPYTLSYSYSTNSHYPASPSSFMCKTTLFDPYQYYNDGDYYALRYIGYMKVPSNGIYSLKMWCNEICQFLMTKNNVETGLGSFVIANYRTPGSVEMSTGQLSSTVFYPIKAFIAEDVGNDYIRIQHKSGSSAYSSAWNGMIFNLITDSVGKSIPAPILVMINSTAISATLPSAPHLSPLDTWAYDTNHEVCYYKVGDETNVQKILITGKLPQTVIATGLSKYTDYQFYAHYFGKIDKADNNIVSPGAIKKTDEDVPETAPPNVAAATSSSTSILVTWRTFTDMKLWNGVGIGFEIRYKIKTNVSSAWQSILISSVGNRRRTVTSLNEYTTYEFKVAGRTSKGSGIFSAVVEERTMEDVPSAAPLNIQGQNRSSSSIELTWDNVPSEHQNGIITGYKVYVKKTAGDSSWGQHEVSVKTFPITGLDIWTFYDFKVSAKTSVGEGTISSVIKVRTGEDKPGGAPRNVKSVPMSPYSVDLTWIDIDPTRVYGLIISYIVKFKRTDRAESAKETMVYEKKALIDNLEEYVEYEFQVAGVTKKGTGIFSNKVLATTLQSAPAGAPENLRGHFNSSTSIRVYWEEIQKKNQNGLITSYTVGYRKKLSLQNWKNESVAPSVMSLVVGNLSFYTIYEFRVAGSTSGGIGPFSSPVDIRTDQDGPTRPPQNLSGSFLDHRSIDIRWKSVPKDFRHGIIQGYKIFYKDASVSNQQWKYVVVNGSESLNATVAELKIYTPYQWKIMAFTNKSDGVISTPITVWTDEYAPDEAPANITGQNATSTEVVLKWKAMEEADGQANGKVLGYIVKYRVIDCHEDRPSGCDENEVFNITSNGSLSEIRIPSLRKFTKYSFSIQVFNSKGKGNFSTVINVTTGEDKPDASPINVETWPSTFDAIKVYWSPIPESHRNGIILGYRLFYKSIDTPMLKYNRAPRSVNPLAIYGAEPGENMKDVNATVFETEIAELKNYSWYQVRIGAYTSKGLGATFTLNGTTKQKTPTEAPELEVTDMLGFYEMFLQWKPIKKSVAHGEVLGYRIEYWMLEKQEIQIPKTQTLYVDVLEPNRTVVLQNLEPFAQYMMRIQAFTEAGFGVWSDRRTGDTCRCPKVVSSARLVLPPLIQSYDSLEVLPRVMDEAITSCCGNCSGKHGITTVNWQKDALNKTSVKYSREEALKAIATGTHLALPIFKDIFELQGDAEKSGYVYIPLVESKRLAIFMKNPTQKELGNSASTIVARSVFEQLPFIGFVILVTAVAGIVLWFLESKRNRESFSDSFIKGSGSGVWLAFITMTTVGYGDLVPVTKIGQIFTMLWMLIGLVMTSIIVGNLSSVLSIEFAIRMPTIEPTGKVLTSTEYLMLTAQFYGGNVVLGNVSDGKFVQKSLLSGDISRVALEFFKAGTLKDYLIHPNIILEKTQEISASYGIALAGEMRILKQCISRFSREKEQEVLEKLKRNQHIYETAAAIDSNLIHHMSSGHSDIMENLTKFGGVLLAVLLAIGIVYELIKYVRARPKIESEAGELERMATDMERDIFKLLDALSKSIEELEKKHLKETLKLSRMEHGVYTTLLAKYPHLHMFDPDLPFDARDKGKASIPVPLFTNEECTAQDSDQEDDRDMPMDFKMDSRF